MSLICETVTADNMRDLRRLRDASVADMVELRLDGVTDVDVAAALDGRSRPVLVTCRAAWEGGRFDGSEESRLGILGDAIRGGAEFVDVERRANRKTLPSAGATRLVTIPMFLDTVTAAIAGSAVKEVYVIGDAVGYESIPALNVLALGDLRILRARGQRCDNEHESDNGSQCPGHDVRLSMHAVSNWRAVGAHHWRPGNCR